MYCENCSTEIKENDRFCGNCGTEVNINKESEEKKGDLSINEDENLSSKVEGVPDESRKFFGGIYHPWRRLGARAVDSIMVTIILQLSIKILLASSIVNLEAIEKVSKSFFFMTVIGYVMLAPIEALFLSKFGTTPGKTLCGITVLNKYGEKLTYFEAFERNLMILLYAEGLGLHPLVSLVTRLVSYQKLTKSGTTFWDKDKYVVNHKKWTDLRILGVLLIFVVFPIIFGSYAASVGQL